MQIVSLRFTEKVKKQTTFETSKICLIGDPLVHPVLIVQLISWFHQIRTGRTAIKASTTYQLQSRKPIIIISSSWQLEYYWDFGTIPCSPMSLDSSFLGITLKQGLKVVRIERTSSIHYSDRKCITHAPCTSVLPNTST